MTHTLFSQKKVKSKLQYWETYCSKRRTVIFPKGERAPGPHWHWVSPEMLMGTNAHPNPVRMPPQSTLWPGKRKDHLKVNKTSFSSSVTRELIRGKNQSSCWYVSPRRLVKRPVKSVKQRYIAPHYPFDQGARLNLPGQSTNRPLQSRQLALGMMKPLHLRMEPLFLCSPASLQLEGVC